MAISDEYTEYVLDQLRGLGQVTARKMFGGVGFYLDEIFFALTADDVLYFKVDETNRADYEKEGMGPFRPYENEGPSMSYYEVPADILENREKLQFWGQKSFEIAKKRKKAGKKHKK